MLLLFLLHIMYYVQQANTCSRQVVTKRQSVIGRKGNIGQLSLHPHHGARPEMQPFAGPFLPCKMKILSVFPPVCAHTRARTRRPRPGVYKICLDRCPESLRRERTPEQPETTHDARISMTAGNGGVRASHHRKRVTVVPRPGHAFQKHC